MKQTVKITHRGTTRVIKSDGFAIWDPDAPKPVTDAGTGGRQHPPTGAETAESMVRAEAFAAACRDGFTTRPACHQLRVSVGIGAGIPYVRLIGPSSDATLLFLKPWGSPSELASGVWGSLAYFHDAGPHGTDVINSALAAVATIPTDEGES